MINWTVRIKNKNFWLAVIPAVLLLAQTVAAVFGYSLDLGEIGNRLIAVVNAVFGVLVCWGWWSIQPLPVYRTAAGP